MAHRLGVLLQAKLSGAAIARRLEFSRWTINREINRCKALPTSLAVDYQAGLAHVRSRQQRYAGAFEKFELAIPPGGVLARFDEIDVDCFDQVANLARQNERLMKARDLLLPRLMSGELTV